MTEDGRAFLPRDKISKVQLIYEENELGPRKEGRKN